MHEAEDYADLPPVLAEIATIVGRDNALAIARARGGEHVWFPQKMNDRGIRWLVDAIGPVAARELLEHLASQFMSYLDIPLATTALRGDAILAAIGEGLSSSQIARKLNVSERTVRRYRALLRSSSKC